MSYRLIVNGIKVHESEDYNDILRKMQDHQGEKVVESDQPASRK
jgi:hypothetical protein